MSTGEALAHHIDLTNENVTQLLDTYSKILLVCDCPSVEKVQDFIVLPNGNKTILTDRNTWMSPQYTINLDRETLLGEYYCECHNHPVGWSVNLTYRLCEEYSR